MRSFSESYRDAGVNIEAGYEGVKLMKTADGTPAETEYERDDV